MYLTDEKIGLLSAGQHVIVSKPEDEFLVCGVLLGFALDVNGPKVRVCADSDGLERRVELPVQVQMR